MAFCLPFLFFLESNGKYLNILFNKLHLLLLLLRSCVCVYLIMFGKRCEKECRDRLSLSNLYSLCSLMHARLLQFSLYIILYSIIF